jgi:hypothetical protein
MRKIILATIVALSVSGCATTPGAPVPTVDERINQAIAIARQVCNYVPTVATVVSMFNAGYGSAFLVASAICTAVLPPPGAVARRAASGRPIACGPSGRCVEVRGSFVR